jgi:hypothetical protein
MKITRTFGSATGKKSVTLFSRRGSSPSRLKSLTAKPIDQATVKRIFQRPYGMMTESNKPWESENNKGAREFAECGG